MLLKIDVHFQDDDITLDQKWIYRIAATVLEGENRVIETLVNIVLVDDAYIQNLNRNYLDKDNPTDVIAFPMEEDEIFGEVYVSVDTARIQAETYHVTFQEEVARLVIHGVLHLLGYDDLTDEAKAIMSAKENEYLEKLSPFE